MSLQKKLSLTGSKIVGALLIAVPVVAQDAGESVPVGQDAVGNPAATMCGDPSFMFMMAAMFAIVYFFMIRPEKKKQKERQAMLAALKKGDKVVTIGGIVGEITAVKDTSYVVKSGEGAVLEFTKSAVSNVLNGNGTDASADGKESR